VGDSQKIPFLQSLGNFVDQKTRSAEEIRGRALPCHVVKVEGQIVTVQFDLLPTDIQYPQVRIPVATFAYISVPVQVGDKGVTMPADVSLRGVSGLGTGIATLSLPPSLSALVFVPVANAAWEKPEPNKLVLYGPDGAIVKTMSGGALVSVADDAITLKVGEQLLELSSSGLKHNGVNIGATHKHDVKGVESGDSMKTSEVPT
jgi:hypothetical protein